MYNRTQQLKSLAEGVKQTNTYTKDCIVVVQDVTLPYVHEGGDDEEFDASFREYMNNVKDARALIASIDDGAKAINALMELSASAVTNEQSAGVSTKLNDIIARVNEACTKCKGITTILQGQKDQGTPTEKRMRTNACNVCLNHFQASIKRYQDAQIVFKKAIKERTARQIQLIYPDAEPGELERLMAPANAHTVLETAARSSIVGNNNLVDAVQTIQSKYNDVLALEESVEELHQMMVELAGVVSYQGDLIDQVEFNTLKAVEYTEKANVELVKARSLRMRNSKIIMYITIGLTLAGLAVAIPIILKIT
ncbi:SNARE domain containing protein protein [Babesia ovis]|uniref:SNARE domain containing protein protein n=1 Tax=Babesia ovis TaxID=5869 RepID=A0A9W5WTL7_BABOV|nr:SNARE domain containing protein protein [Babesia ovis]